MEGVRTCKHPDQDRVPFLQKSMIQNNDGIHLLGHESIDSFVPSLKSACSGHRTSCATTAATTITCFFALTIYANASSICTHALTVILLSSVFELTVSPPSFTFGTFYRVEIPCAVSLIKTDFTYQWCFFISMIVQ